MYSHYACTYLQSLYVGVYSCMYHKKHCLTFTLAFSGIKHFTRSTQCIIRLCEELEHIIPLVIARNRICTVCMSRHWLNMYVVCNLSCFLSYYCCINGIFVTWLLHQHFQLTGLLLYHIHSSLRVALPFSLLAVAQKRKSCWTATRQTSSDTKTFLCAV